MSTVHHLCLVSIFRVLGKSGVTEKCLKVVHSGVWGQCNCRRDGGVQSGGLHKGLALG